MNTVTIKCNEKVSRMPGNHILTSDLARLFGTKEDGMHLKYQSGNQWENVWPVNGFFNVPDSCKEVFLIAIDDTQADDTPRHSAGNFSFHHRRGNAAIPSLSGPRPIPSFKRKESNTPVPLKKKKIESCFKIVCISDIEIEMGEPNTIFEVPIDLSKLESMYGDFTIQHMQNEVAFQVGGTSYVLTNKKGHPIRDMPNTRGKSNWNNKSTVRAIPTESYMKMKPNMWKIVRKDYGYDDEDSSEDIDDDLFLRNVFPDAFVENSHDAEKAGPSLAPDNGIADVPSSLNLPSVRYVSNTELKELLVEVKGKKLKDRLKKISKFS